MSKLFLYLIKHEPNGKVLNNKEIGQLKKIFFGNEKNIITTGLSELIGWDDLFNNDDDKENINIEKILPSDDILTDEYFFKDEDEFDEAINGDEDNDNLDDNHNLILNNLSQENINNELGNLLLKYQNILRDVDL